MGIHMCIIFDVALVFINMYFPCLDFSQTLDASTFPKLSVALPITPSSSPLSLSLSLCLPPGPDLFPYFAPVCTRPSRGLV